MSEFPVIDQQCALIEKQGMSIIPNQLKECLDTIVVELNKHNLRKNINTIKQILASIRIAATKLCSEFGSIDHPLFLILRDLYLDILRRWRSDEALDTFAYEGFLKISILFDSLCAHVDDANVNRFKELLIEKPLIDELGECLTEIATTGKHLQDQQINAIDFMIRAIYRIFHARVQIQNDPLLKPLVDAITNCVCSSYSISIFTQITEFKELNEAQTLLLETCPDYFSWYGGHRRDEFCIVIRMTLLSPFTQWLLNHVSSFRQWSKVTINAVKKLGNIILDFDMQHEMICSPAIYDDCYKIIDAYIFILSSLSKATSDEFPSDLTGVVLLQLYLLTLDQNLLSYIKSQQLPPILVNLVNVANEYVQFNAYRILASILTEQDIKELANPSTIANVFLKFLTNVIDDPNKILRLRSLLRGLKSKCNSFQFVIMIFRVGLAQHDQIKEELIKQGMLSLLLRCATEVKFNPLKEQQPALEILLALTFNDQAAMLLKQNSQFISHIKILLTSSPEKGVRRAAERLIWKLEKEELVTATSVAAVTHAYDIMLNYSHTDKDLCYRIYERLTEDHFRVWIDRDHMYGATMATMAHAIENSQCVVFCMSDAYKQSAYCQSEAHYAFERRCHFVPVVMKQTYRPDGWLGIMVSGKIYIDFHKLEFEEAYLKLKAEIRQHRKILSHPTTVSTEQFQHESPAKTVVIEQQVTVKDYPHCLDLWTKDHLQSFVIEKNFNSLLPVLANMNGRAVHELYIMCKTNRESMFQTMRSEVAVDGQQKPLTLGTYLCFLDEIQKYISHTPADQSQSSTNCTLM